MITLTERERNEREFQTKQIDKLLNNRTKEARKYIRSFFEDLCAIDWNGHDFLSPSIYIINVVFLERKREGKE